MIDLRSAEDQVGQVTAQLKSSLTLGPSAVTKNILQRRPGQGSAAASSSDPQPLAEHPGHVEGSAVTSKGGQRAVQQFKEELDLMGCGEVWPAVATPEAKVALETAGNIVQGLATVGATGDAGGGSTRESPPEEDDGRESEATNQWEEASNQSSQVSR